MCGFCGIALGDPSARVDAEVLRAMRDTLLHRGPDDGHSFVEGSVGVGFRRLSIIDLEGGRQPIPNEAEDIVLVMNGEIYNHLELREGLAERGHRFRTGSDAEVLVHLYEEVGEVLVQQLVGMFAFCLLDLRGPVPKVVLGRDRLGIKPLYYVHSAQGLAWASEPKALLELGASPRDLRPEALLDYLVQGYSGGPPGRLGRDEPPAPGPHPDLDGGGGAAPAAPLGPAPGGRARSSAGRGDPGAARPLRRGPFDGRRAPGGLPVGGIDSNAVVASMARVSPDPVVACSMGFAERSHDELDLARAAARRFGARHHTEVVDPDPTLAAETLPWFFDEPHADPSTLPTYLVSRMARQHVTVALSGDGGDETFAGYRRYVHDLAENRLRARDGGGRARARPSAAGQRVPASSTGPRASCAPVPSSRTSATIPHGPTGAA